MKKYFKLLRVTHYVKNGLIFLPLIFSKQIFSLDFFNVLYGTIAFCFMSSVVYIINDIKDVEKDRLHPVKLHRPIASTKISIKTAIIIAMGLFFMALIFNYLAAGFDIKVISLLLVYLIINICYSLGLKNIAIIDILVLVTGFILRVYYGASIIDVDVSDWLYLTVMSASFFFAFGKRRNEIIKNKDNSRKVLSSYTKDFLDKNMYLSLTLTIAFYSLWAVAQEINYLIITIPLVMTIIMKYTLVIEGDSHGDPTDILYKDRILQGLVIVFGVMIIYLMK